MVSRRVLLGKCLTILLAICFGIYYMYGMHYINKVRPKEQQRKGHAVALSSISYCDLPENHFKTFENLRIMPSNLADIKPVFPNTKRNNCMTTVEWKSLAIFTKYEEKQYYMCVRNNNYPRSIFENSIQRLDWNITFSFFSFFKGKSDVFIIEIGGFTGQLLKKLIPVTGAKYYVVLEPVPSFFRNLTYNIKELRLNSSIKSYNFGLGRDYKKLAVSIQGDATSILKDTSQKTEYIKIVSVVDFFVRLGVGCHNIDLLTINCEGCEFDVLETLLSTTLIEKVEYIQFQPHHAVPNLGDYTCRYCRLRHLLMRTHEIAYEYPHVWETWKRK